MKNLIIGIAVGGVLAAGGVLGVQQLFSNETKPVVIPAGPAGSGGAKAATSGVIDLAQVDMDKSSGWYQGKLSISESRAGVLTVEGNKFVVSRPAMFQRFGVSINKESFTVDRTTGAFEQSLGITDGRTVKLIRGTCAKVIKPPF
jgi:hypothetical protein